ncbi:TPM domain-containing protein [Pseudomonas sp. MSSRFD41]|uniref:TPM domain-containing protein n=2 Tax=unclassified Pseudomonas TaxID=196821 RepID=UPI00163A39D6|nr:TPM domain-containing protein [Pseudomonas sp. MSSRFD41]MBC2659896.1 TPM domain-containing protein [Pseudomonas sp. MSSRFD41]
MIKVWLQQGRGLWLALFLGLLPALVHAEEAPPGLVNVPLDRRVIDLTATLDSVTQERMVHKLEALEQRRGAQIAVMLVPHLGQQSIEALGNQLFRAWKLGRKGADDGILLLVAKNDRKVRIEVGYGLEPVVTDLLAGQIIARDLVPAFRQGDFAGGIDRALDDLILLVDGDLLPEPAGLPEPVERAVPLEAYALLLAFVFGSVAGVMLAAGWNWRRVLGGAVVLMAVLVGAVGGQEWLAQLFVVPLCMLIGGATFAGLWQARGVFYGVLGLLLYIGLLTLLSQYLGSLTFLYGLAWPAGVLLVLGGHWLLYWMMRNSWRRSPRGFLWRFAVLLTLVLLMGLGVDAWQAAQRWLTVVPFAYFLSFILFAGGIGLRWSSGGGSSGGGHSSAGGGFSGGGGSSGGGGASGSW